MADAIRVSGPVSGTDKTLTFETGKLAQQSQGAVVATIGTTVVLTTANAAKSAREGTDFFPLTVDVEERAYAAGRIPGSFFRREGRPTEDAVLTCRLTDRPLKERAYCRPGTVRVAKLCRWGTPQSIGE